MSFGPPKVNHAEVIVKKKWAKGVVRIEKLNDSPILLATLQRPPVESPPLPTDKCDYGDDVIHNFPVIGLWGILFAIRQEYCAYSAVVAKRSTPATDRVSLLTLTKAPRASGRK